MWINGCNTHWQPAGGVLCCCWAKKPLHNPPTVLLATFSPSRPSFCPPFFCCCCCCCCCCTHYNVMAITYFTCSYLSHSCRPYIRYVHLSVYVCAREHKHAHSNAEVSGCVCVCVSLLPLLCIAVYPDRVNSSDGFIPDDRFMTVCQKASRGPAVTVCACVYVCV